MHRFVMFDRIKELFPDTDNIQFDILDEFYSNNESISCNYFSSLHSKMNQDDFFNHLNSLLIISHNIDSYCNSICSLKELCISEDNEISKKLKSFVDNIYSSLFKSSIPNMKEMFIDYLLYNYNFEGNKTKFYEFSLITKSFFESNLFKNTNEINDYILNSIILLVKSKEENLKNKNYLLMPDSSVCFYYENKFFYDYFDSFKDMLSFLNFQEIDNATKVNYFLTLKEYLPENIYLKMSEFFK